MKNRLCLDGSAVSSGLSMKSSSTELTAKSRTKSCKKSAEMERELRPRSLSCTGCRSHTLSVILFVVVNLFSFVPSLALPCRI